MGENIWEHKDELLKVAEGEKNAGRKNFATVSGLISYAEEIPETTNALGVFISYYFSGKSYKVRAEFLYDTPEYKKKPCRNERILSVGTMETGNRI